MQSQISQLTGHTIVCGYGRLARLLMQELANADAKIVIIENDPQIAQELIEKGCLFIEGSAHDDDTLKSAGVERAATLLSLVSNEADNVYISLVARDLSPNIHIIARAESEAAEAKLKRAGANQILAPYRLSASRLAQQVLRPNVSNFIEVATSTDGRQLLLEEVCVPFGSPLSGKTLQDSALRQTTGAMVAASIDAAGHLTINPSAQSPLLEGQTLIVLGDQEAIDKVTDLVSNGGA